MTLRQHPPRVSTHTTDRSTKQTDPFYRTQQWRLYAKWIVKKRGKTCQECNRPIVIKRVNVDHIIELQDGGAPFDEDNVQVLCGSCHTTKTLRVRGERLR